MNIFKNVPTFGKLTIFGLLGALLSASIFSFFLLVAQASNDDAVGDISMSVIASNSTGPETVEVSFSGSGTLDLTDWTLWDTNTSERKVFTFGSVMLTDGGSFTICHDGSCDGTSTGGATVWNDSGDTAQLRDENGDTVLTVTWASASPDEQFSDSVYVYYAPKTETEIDITGSTYDAVSDPTGSGWFFNPFPPFTAPFEFNTDTASIGDGAFLGGPLTADGSSKIIATLQSFTDVATFESFSYDFNIATNGASDENEFYLNVYANFGSTDPNNFYDCRYDVVPSSGTVGSFETVTFAADATVTNVTTRGTSPHTCPATIGEMETIDPGSVIRAFTLNIGDTGTQDTGVSGYFDNIVLTTLSDIVTYDFEPDTTKPTVAIDSPEDDAVVGPDFTVTGTAEDEQTGISEVLYTVTEIDSLGGSFVANIDSGTASGTEAWSFEVSGLYEGFFRLKVQAFDNAGNHKFRFHDVEVDLTKPLVVISAPMSGDVLDNVAFEVSGTAEDEKTDIATVLFTVTEITALGGTYVDLIASGTANGTENWSFDVQSLDNGFYRLKVQAFDEVGNWRYKFVDVAVMGNKPMLTIISPENGAILPTGTFAVTGTSSDAAGPIAQVLYRVNAIDAIGGTFVSNIDSGIASGTETWSYPVFDLDEGFYRIRAQAFDLNDNFRHAYRDVEVRFNPDAPEVCSYDGVVVSATQGLTNGGDPVDANRGLTSAVEAGKASYTNFFGKEGNDWQVSPLDFYSLGINGELVYEFTDKVAIDGPGDDIAIWEITGGNPLEQAGEKADVYGSEDGVNFVLLGQAVGDASFDISGSGLDFVKFVKLIDQSNGVQGNNGDGFDLDTITIIDESCGDYVTVHTSKIICTDESQLPNWGTGGPNITETTAADWVAENDSCELVDGWEFEYAPRGTKNPGDTLVGPAGGAWETFSGSTVIPMSFFNGKNSFWMREVLQEDHIPFTYAETKNRNDYTAEMYCHRDVKNYDNFDRIDRPKAGEEYHCVAWNVPVEKVEQCELAIVSDTQTLVKELNDFAVETYEHNNWTADIDGATWVWAYEQASTTEVDTTFTFVETFTVATPTSALLDVAADNYYQVFLNGNLVIDKSTGGGNNFQSHTMQEDEDVLLQLIDGENTLEIIVTNIGVDGSDYRSNPAGVLYRLDIVGTTNCDVTTDRVPDEPDPTYTVSGFKFDAATSSELGLAGWTIIASSSDMQLSTTTDSSGAYSFELPAGEWDIYEVLQSGWEQVSVLQNGDGVESDRCTFSLGEQLQGEQSLFSEVSIAFLGNTCDFFNQEIEDENPEQPQPESRTSGGGGTRVTSADPQPLVLGATTSQCPFLTDFMQMGADNDRMEVMKLQIFLNIFSSMYGGTENPVTGTFGAVTDANVKAFQEFFRAEILDPWFEQGIVPHNRPTGFVYKTTLWKINDIVCGAEFPSLEGENLQINVDLDVSGIQD